MGASTAAAGRWQSPNAELARSSKIIEVSVRNSQSSIVHSRSASSAAARP
ncbi:MAG TPA: hypothetical protein VFJ14_05970 [Nocardioidaceae bacterium]|nr:hypothetical protein [Nocardioidaceae bacterium]